MKMKFEIVIKLTNSKEEKNGEEDNKNSIFYLSSSVRL